MAASSLFYGVRTPTGLSETTVALLLNSRDLRTKGMFFYILALSHGIFVHACLRLQISNAVVREIFAPMAALHRDLHSRHIRGTITMRCFGKQ